MTGVSTEPAPVSALSITLDAWRLAVATATPGAASAPEQTDAAWTELAGHGIAAAPGVLADAWRALLTDVAAAPIAMRVVAAHAGFAHVADLTMSGTATTCLLRRLAVEGDADETHVVGVDDRVEFSWTGTGRPWDLIRRVLPPLPELLAEPHATPPSRLEQVDVSLEAFAALTAPGADEAAASGLVSAALRDAADAIATVSLVVLVIPEDVPVAVGERSWALGAEGLHVVGRHDGEAVITDVEPGDIGFHVLGTPSARSTRSPGSPPHRPTARRRPRVEGSVSKRWDEGGRGDDARHGRGVRT